MRITLTSPARRRIFRWKFPRRFPKTLSFVTLILLVPAVAVAQSGSPFDTGFTALQNLFTGTVAKVASLIAIVIGGYEFAHGEPGAKKFNAVEAILPEIGITGITPFPTAPTQIKAEIATHSRPSIQFATVHPISDRKKKPGGKYPPAKPGALYV